MQDTKDLKDQHPAAGPGLEGALGPCVKMGKKNRESVCLVGRKAQKGQFLQNPTKKYLMSLLN